MSMNISSLETSGPNISRLSRDLETELYLGVGPEEIGRKEPVFIKLDGMGVDIVHRMASIVKSLRSGKNECPKRLGIIGFIRMAISLLEVYAQIHDSGGEVITLIDGRVHIIRINQLGKWEISPWEGD